MIQCILRRKGKLQKKIWEQFQITAIILMSN